MKFNRMVDVVFIGCCLCLAGLALDARFDFTKTSPGARTGVVATDRDYREYVAEGAAKTVVLFIHPSCRYCTQSMPFYRRLVTEAEKRQQHVTVRALSTVDEPLLRGYLAEHALARMAAARAQAPPGVTGTPTLLVLDRDGHALTSFTGALSASQEASVLRSLVD